MAENENKSSLEEMIAEIKANTSQVAINRNDEVRVMKEMLNDPNFSVSIYDKNSGYIGQRCPHEEATGFVKNVIQTTTGLDARDSKHLADNYEFTKRDATFMLTNMRDFMSTYLSTGRKINIVQSASSEANLFARDVKPLVKTIPASEGSKETKQMTTSAYTKIISSSKCPKYSK